MDRLNSPFLSPVLPDTDCERAEIPRGWLLDTSSDRAPTAQERVARIVRTIESDIIPRLVRAHRVPVAEPAPPRASTPLPTPLEVDTFLRYVLDDDDAAFTDMIGRMRGCGMAVDDIYLELLAPAARQLGTMWEDDRVMFTDVTVAVGRLQRIMRNLSPGFGSDVDHPADGRRVLLVPTPGEQHTFGLTIVAEFFRHAGWDVVGGAGDSSIDPVAMVRAEWFDVLGISAGAEARLDWLKSGIAAVRQASRNKGIGVMVGGPVFLSSPGLAAAIGADATAADGRQAPAVAEQLLDSRVKRL